MTAVIERPTTRAVPSAPEPQPGGGGWRTLGWAGLYVVLQVVFLLLLRRASPRFFWVDDQQAQYLPVFHWFGRNLTDGRPPLMAPDLGAGGNFVADPQYGALDPAHWLLSAVVSRFENVNNAAMAMSATAILVMGLGIVVLLLRYRCPPPLAVAAALGVASTGMSLWFGSSWWPMAWVTAWLPWFWYGLATRHRRGVLVVGVASWLIAAGGYPYGLLFVLATLVGQVAERVVANGWRALLARELVARALAGAGGLALAVPGLLTALQMGDYTTREVPESLLGNTGELTPNLADVLLGSSTLTPAVAGHWTGALVAAPVAALAVFAVPALAFVRWRGLARRPGVLTAMVTALLAVAATQLPGHFLMFRFPWRFFTEVQLYLPILVALALGYARVVTRGRAAAALLLLLAQFGLAAFRAPNQTEWHLLALLLGVLAAAAVALSAPARRRALAAGAAVVLVGSSLAGALLSERAATALLAEDQEMTFQPLTGEPARSLPTRPFWGTTLTEFREQASATPERATVFRWDGELSAPEQGWGTGFLAGNANLLADRLPGYSYHAAGSRAWAYYGCGNFLGALNTFPTCQDTYFEPVPGYPGKTWLDVLSSDEVLLSRQTPERVRDGLREEFQPAGSVGLFTRLVRNDGLPGRVTATRGFVTVEPASQQRSGPTVLDQYRVSSSFDGGALVLRIPWWPGIEAEVDGRPVQVSSVNDAVTEVRLPGGLQDASLTLDFRPVGERILVPALLGGSLLVLAGVVVGGPLRRRRSARHGSTRVSEAAAPGVHH